MVLLVDNYDSFVHNLARYVRELSFDALVARNDALTLSDVESLTPSHIIISPGPCSPAESGISTDLVRRFAPAIPILGVCLGHQCIGAAYGAPIVRARRPMHGKTSPILHDGSSIFTGLPSPFTAARYHSLAIAGSSIPDELRVLASTEDGEVMAVEHRRYPVIGLQFHPESAATEFGYLLLGRFLTGHIGNIDEFPNRADGAMGTLDRGALADSPWTSRRTETPFPGAAPIRP
jgi:anthranilate synthase/aminodeoxychorismate synthase-like glutamine amidotransferase